MTDDDPQGPLLNYAGPAWIPPPENTAATPGWLNGRAIAGVWRDTLPFVAGAMKASTRFPHMMPGAGWRTNPEPDSAQDVDQAIAAKFHLGLRSLSILAVAQLVVVHPSIIQGIPDWETHEELCEYAALAALPASPLFLDLESRQGRCPSWEVESWPGPFNLRGALVWRRDRHLSIIPFGSLDGRHPWGGTDYQAWARWVFLADADADGWPPPGPGDCLARRSGATLCWVQAESASICANQAAVAYHLARRALRVLWMLDVLDVEFIAPPLSRAERRRAHRAQQQIGLIPAGVRELVPERPEDDDSWTQMTVACPVPNTHARLNQAHALWHEALDVYQDPKAFMGRINLLIQTLRNVTWALQKEIAPHPQLADWYAQWQSRMRDDQHLRWVRDARNKIVKQGDLLAHSTARVRIVGEMLRTSSIDVDVDPAKAADEIVRELRLGALPDRVRREGTLLVERRWTVEALPNDELLDVLARSYSMLARIVDEAHERLATALVTCQESAEDPCRSWRFTHHASGRLPCMSAGRAARTSRRDLSTGAPTTVTSMAVSRPQVDDELLQRRYPDVTSARLPVNADVFDIAESFHGSARSILITDGYHVTLAWLIRDHQPISMHQLNPREQRDKYLMIEQLAEEATELGADGLIITSEAWEADVADPTSDLAELRASERHDRTEALVTHALRRDGAARTWRSAMTRAGGDLKLGDVVVDEHVPPLLRPMVEIWATWPTS